MKKLLLLLFRYPILPPIFLTVVIFILSVMSGLKLPKIDSDWLTSDKIGHLMAYLTLTFSWLMGWKALQNHNLSKKQVAVIVLFCCAFGLLMEVLQGTLFTYRSFEWADFIANSIGAMLGVVVYRRIA